jgi:hypothetical protein
MDLGYLVECVDDIVAELVEGFNDFAEDSLVGKILVHGELDECLHHGALLDLAPLFLGDAAEGGLEFLDLDEGGVAERVEKSECLINCRGGFVVLGHEGLVVSVVLLTEEGLLSQVLSVMVNVFLDLSDILANLVETRHEEIGDGIFDSDNISNCVPDVLLKRDDLAVVLVGAFLEIELKILNCLGEIMDQLLDGVNEFIDSALSVRVHLDHGEHGTAPSRLLEVLDGFHLDLLDAEIGSEDASD